MASIDDEKLVFLASERLVVHNPLEEEFLFLIGPSLDCIYPGSERCGVEGIREEVVVILSSHQFIQLWRKGANGL